MTERRELEFELNVEEIFRLADGRTVFVGTVDDEGVILIPGRCELLRDGKAVATFDVAPELFGDRDGRRVPLQAVSTSDPVEVSMDDLNARRYLLRGRMRMRGFRHLVGIESPPKHFVPDRMTLGPRLPEGWDGDAWTSPDESAFFLRAWNQSMGRYAIGTGARYEDARAALLQEISHGGRPVVVKPQDAAT